MYSLYSMVIQGTSPVIIDQLESRNVDGGLSQILASGSGNIDPTHASVGAADPKVTIVGTNLKTILDKLGLDGLAIDTSIATATDVEMWTQKRADGGKFGGGLTDHIRTTVNKGIMYPVSLDMQLGESASLNFELLPLYDGTNDPVLVEDGQDTANLPAAQVDNRWTAGPVYINGTRIQFVQSIRLNFGIQITPIKSAGDIWPTQASITARNLTCEFDFLDYAQVDKDALFGNTSESGYIGKAITGVTRAYAAKKVLGGLVATDATAEHIEFDFMGGRVHISGSQKTHQGNVVVTAVITPINTGGNEVLVIDTASAINSI